MYLLLLLTILGGFSKLTLINTYPTENFREDKIHFYFWNKTIQEQEVRLGYYGNITKAPTKFLIHGFLDKGNGEDFFFYGPLTQKYITTGANVICIDWSFYSRRIYSESVLWLRSVANLIANFIMELNQKNLVLFSDVHILGHSLGAHMAGFIGKYIQQTSQGRKIDRITGLDPAGPRFHTRPDTDRLSKTDAVKVDTVISDIHMFGMNKTLGQVNFYANCGGPLQLELVNHLLGPYYYAYGILKNDLIARKCSCFLYHIVNSTCQPQPTNILGQNVDFNKTGTYYKDIRIMPMMIDMKDSMKGFQMNKIKTNFEAFFKSVSDILKGLNNAIL